MDELKKCWGEAVFGAATMLAVLLGPAALGDDGSAESFDRAVAPILARRCIGCHDTISKKGGLDLTHAVGVQIGGEAGPALYSAEPEKGLLWQRISADEMPPGKPLSAEEKGLLKRWIADGARWGTDPINPYQFSHESRAGYDWWSLRPVRLPAVPTVDRRESTGNEIDHFIRSRLATEKLAPARRAAPRTLLRRLYFDLIGLPPLGAEVNGVLREELLDVEIDLAAFHEQPAAYAAVVEKLLASHHYGERWGRHWLDVIRFGESQGFERNRIRENAWRFRDWVIDAFQRDLPFDEFVRMQIAGDVLYPNDLPAHLATGFLVCGTWDQVGHKEGSPEMQRQVREEHLEDLVGGVGQAFLGLTTQCARCHDHKFDPISQREYYQLAAALGGVSQDEEEWRDSGKFSQVDPSWRDREYLHSFAGFAHGVIPKQPGLFHVLSRGDYRQPQEVVSPAGLQSVSQHGLFADFGLKPDAPEADRRIALAQWIAAPHNPLTPRVIVNRLWHYHFGSGIVDTPSDFGFSGGRPSHPELLDWLAHRFMAQGWSIKAMHRLIVTSATWQSSSIADSAAANSADRDNRLLWRGNARRLDAESVRDAMLAVSGALNRQLGGPSFRDIQVTGGVMGKNAEFTEPIGEFSSATCRRTIYRLWARSGNNPLLEALDCPDPSVATPRRAQTITPIQALSLFNSQFTEQCAKHLVHRAGADKENLQEGVTDEAIDRTVERLYLAVLGRIPRAEERLLTRLMVRNHGFDQLAMVLLNTNEFQFVE